MKQIMLKDDHLDRGRYARSLYNIIGDYKVENGQPAKPMTNTDNKAFIVAVSAPWGTGKTFFMKSFQKVLQRDLDAITEGIALFDGNIAFSKDSVIYYDAWLNDFWNNAFEPLFDNILNSGFGIKARADAELDKAWKAMTMPVSGAADIIKGTMKSAGKLIPSFEPFADGVSETVKVAKEGIPEYFKTLGADFDPTKEVFPEYKLFYTAIQTLKKNLEVTINKYGKIAIIIDELDRCKPTFAVQTLEIVKHLFNVPGIVFVFSLDLIQLQHCVKVVYGQEFDAIGYLERFFDYASLLPQGNQKKLFFNTCDIFEIEKEDALRNSFYEICDNFHLSIREIRAVCSSFHYLNQFELQGYPTHAKQLYFYLLVLKYKKPVEVMESISNRKTSSAIREELINDYSPVFDPDNGHRKTFTEAFIANPIIGMYDQYRHIHNSGSTTLVDKYSIETNGVIKNQSRSTVFRDGSLSYALYPIDIQDYDSIKDMTLLEYLFRKVELYDTALPTE